MSKKRTARTIIVSMVAALLALSFLAFTASASTTAPGAACSAVTPSASLTHTVAGQQVFSPAKLSVKSSAAGAFVCIKNATASMATLANHGQAIGLLAPNQSRAFQVQASEANGSSVISLMPARAAGPSLTISFKGRTAGHGAAPAASCSATTPWASLSKTAIGSLVFSPAKLSVKSSAAGAIVCIKNSTASVATLASNGQVIGLLAPNQSRTFQVTASEANGSSVISLMPARAAGPTLTISFKGRTAGHGAA